MNEQRPYQQYFHVDDDKILGFFEEYRFLSNFHLAEVHYQGELYPSSEHAYQAAKFLNKEYRKNFQNKNLSCGQSRKLGNIKTESFDPKWDENKYKVMYEIVFDKFQRHPNLQEKLVNTGNRHLEETNHWGDEYWGVNYKSRKGKNYLGKILMLLRDYWQKKHGILKPGDIAQRYREGQANYEENMRIMEIKTAQNELDEE